MERIEAFQVSFLRISIDNHHPLSATLCAIRRVPIHDVCLLPRFPKSRTMRIRSTCLAPSGSNLNFPGEYPPNIPSFCVFLSLSCSIFRRPIHLRRSSGIEELFPFHSSSSSFSSMKRQRKWETPEARFLQHVSSRMSRVHRIDSREASMERTATFSRRSFARGYGNDGHFLLPRG